jgi:hypothetical protein
MGPTAEGALRIFPPLKIRRLRPGLNPRTWVPEASALTPRPPKPRGLSKSDKIIQYAERGGGNWAGINSLRTGCGPVDCDTTQTCGQPRTIHKNTMLPSSWRRLDRIQKKNMKPVKVILAFYQLFIDSAIGLLSSRSDKTRDKAHKGT